MYYRKEELPDTLGDFIRDLAGFLSLESCCICPLLTHQERLVPESEKYIKVVRKAIYRRLKWQRRRGLNSIYFSTKPPPADFGFAWQRHSLSIRRNWLLRLARRHTPKRKEIR